MKMTASRRTSSVGRVTQLIGAWALFFVVSAAGTPALADPNEDAAREATKRGTAAYNLGAYEEAAKNYEQAYRLVQDPILLFNVGQSWRLAGKPDKALIAYKAYLRTGPQDAPNREQVERRIPELEQVISETKRTQSAPPAGTLAVLPPAEASGQGAASIVESPGSAPLHGERTPIYGRWWFWAGAGALVAGYRGVRGAPIIRGRTRHLMWGRRGLLFTPTLTRWRSPDCRSSPCSPSPRVAAARRARCSWWRSTATCGCRTS